MISLAAPPLTFVPPPLAAGRSLPVAVVVGDHVLADAVRRVLAGMAGLVAFDGTTADGFDRLLHTESTVGVVHLGGMGHERRARLATAAKRFIALVSPGEALGSLPAGCFDACVWPNDRHRLPTALEHLRERQQLLLKVCDLERKLRDLQPATAGDVLPFEQVEKAAILNALHVTRGNIRDAARLLGLGQATVYRKIKRYGVNRTDRARQTGNGQHAHHADRALVGAYPDNASCG